MGRQHQGMDRPGVRQVPEGSGEQGEMEEIGCEIICGPTNDPRGKGIDDDDDETTRRGISLLLKMKSTHLKTRKQLDLMAIRESFIGIAQCTLHHFQ